MKKVAAYLRVSTSEQTTDNQLLSIQAYCKTQNCSDKRAHFRVFDMTALRMLRLFPRFLS